jgi:MFS family permease
MAEDPVLPLEFFKHRAFVGSVSAVALCAVGMFGALLFLPLFAQNVLGYGATSAGLVLTPLLLGAVAASALTGQVVARTGRYKWVALFGMAVGALGMYLLSFLSAGSSHLELIAKMVVAGVGLGVSFPIFTVVVQNTFEHKYLGVATGSVQLFRNIGGAVGTALLGGLFNYGLLVQHLSFTQALSHVYWVVTGLMVVAFISVCFIPELPLRKSNRPRLEEAEVEIGEAYGVELP